MKVLRVFFCLMCHYRRTFANNPKESSSIAIAVAMKNFSTAAFRFW